MSNAAPNVTKTPHQRKIRLQNERRRRQSEQQQEREQQRLEQLAGLKILPVARHGSSLQGSIW